MTMRTLEKSMNELEQTLEEMRHRTFSDIDIMSEAIADCDARLESMGVGVKAFLGLPAMSPSIDDCADTFRELRWARISSESERNSGFCLHMASWKVIEPKRGAFQKDKRSKERITFVEQWSVLERILVFQSLPKLLAMMTDKYRLLNSAARKALAQEPEQKHDRRPV